MKIGYKSYMFKKNQSLFNFFTENYPPLILTTECIEKRIGDLGLKILVFPIIYLDYWLGGVKIRMDKFMG